MEKIIEFSLERQQQWYINVQSFVGVGDVPFKTNVLP